jgi:hypothetical protein
MVKSILWLGKKIPDPEQANKIVRIRLRVRNTHWKPKYYLPQ